MVASPPLPDVTSSLPVIGGGPQTSQPPVCLGRAERSNERAVAWVSRRSRPSPLAHGGLAFPRASASCRLVSVVLGHHP
jgi:hypothetical protein